LPLTCGLVGLPNAGKSTLFRALTAARAEVAPYPFTTIAPNIGVTSVPDPRLNAIAAITKPTRVVPATLEVVDIAGLVRNAHKGEGLGNEFLGRIREVDALVHVVRCFGGDVAHVEGGVDPIRDIEIVETELLLADLAAVRRARERTGPRVRTGDRDARERDAVLARLEGHLDAARPARAFLKATAKGAPRPAATPGAGSPPDDTHTASEHLLTARPVLYVANLSEEDRTASHCLDAVRAYATDQGSVALGVCAKLEMELAELPAAEAEEFRSSLGIEERGATRLIQACQSLLGLRTFFSIASDEVRAWPVPAGTRAPQAAGRIHTDMERGFIRAEVVNSADLVACGSVAAARERGLVRLEGKEYEVRDGDVITFRFAV
jgi:ribosome-binding ATPase